MQQNLQIYAVTKSDKYLGMRVCLCDLCIVIFSKLQSELSAGDSLSISGFPSDFDFCLLTDSTAEHVAVLWLCVSFGDKLSFYSHDSGV